MVKRTILVAEDEEPLRKALNQKLKAAGFDVIEAADGEEAYDLAINHHPDLILLDQLMPKLTGLAVLERIRQDQVGDTDGPLRRGGRRFTGKFDVRAGRFSGRRRRGSGRGERRYCAGPDGQAGSAATIHRGSHRTGTKGRDGQHCRPRRRDPPDHGYPHAPTAEQSHPHG